MAVTIRKLIEDDRRAFSEVRLRALQTDPRVFGSNYESESKFAEADWRERLQSEDSAIFMLYDGETPVGVTGVSVYREDENGATAIFWGS